MQHVHILLKNNRKLIKAINIILLWTSCTFPQNFIPKKMLSVSVDMKNWAAGWYQHRTSRCSRCVGDEELPWWTWRSNLCLQPCLLVPGPPHLLSGGLLTVQLLLLLLLPPPVLISLIWRNYPASMYRYSNCLSHYTQKCIIASV